MEPSLNHIWSDRDERESCPFLDILPLEVREIIYKYLLMVKFEDNGNSYEVCIRTNIHCIC